MTWARMRLGLTALLFVLWLGWLAYLAFSSTNAIVLSRPQFLVSNLDVTAQVTAQDRPVTILKVHFPADKEAQALAGKEIEVSNLAQCAGWAGPGTYILALTSDGKGKYQVTPTPRSPGYEGGKPRIYPETPRTLEQLREIESRKAQAPPLPE